MHRALEPDVAAVRAAQSQVRSADILVAAVGQPQLVRGSWIKPGAFIIDVGINSIKGTRNTHVAGSHSTPARPAPSRRRRPLGVPQTSRKSRARRWSAMSPLTKRSRLREPSRRCPAASAR